MRLGVRTTSQSKSEKPWQSQSSKAMNGSGPFGLVDSRPPPIDKLISQNAVQRQRGLVDRGQWDAGRPAFVCPLGLSVANLNGTVSSRIEMRKFDNGCVLALRTY